MSAELSVLKDKYAAVRLPERLRLPRLITAGRQMLRELESYSLHAKDQSDHSLSGHWEKQLSEVPRDQPLEISPAPAVQFQAKILHLEEENKLLKEQVFLRNKIAEKNVAELKDRCEESNKELGSFWPGGAGCDSVLQRKSPWTSWTLPVRNSGEWSNLATKTWTRCWES